MFQRAYANPYLLLVLTTLSFGGNAVASRLAVDQISPMLLTSARWALVVVLMGVFLRRRIAADWPAVRANWRAMILMGACGFTGFNALFYLAAHHTTAVNISIIQGAIPVLVMLGAVLIQRAPVRPGQAIGMAVTLLGVAVVASGGHLETLLRLALGRGDVFMLIACVLYAGYILMLRRTGGAGLAFFSGLAAAAFVTSLPLAGWEAAAGDLQAPTLRGWGVLAYTAFLPSFLAQIFFMRAVQLIGPSRAGLFINLVPVFGALLSVLILHEPFGLHHAVAIGLVLSGIYLAERSAGRAGKDLG